MTVEEFYTQLGADYGAVLRRMGKAERVQRFLGMFLRDDSCDALCRAMEAGDGEEAFRAAHTLKGVGANLGLCGIQQEAGRLTDLLRGGRITPEAQALLEDVKREYSRTVQGIRQL